MSWTEQRDASSSSRCRSVRSCKLCDELTADVRIGMHLLFVSGVSSSSRALADRQENLVQRSKIQQILKNQSVRGA